MVGALVLGMLKDRKPILRYPPGPLRSGNAGTKPATSSYERLTRSDEGSVSRILSDAEKRTFKPRRALNIALRTVHIGATGALFGGHVFDVAKEQLVVWLAMAVASGAVLTVIEAYPKLHWCIQGRGAAVILKMLLLCTIPWLWSYRVPILAAVIIIASVGSHMPARFRYYSLVHQRVLEN